MIFPKVQLQTIIVHKVLRLSSSPITDKASFVLLSAMNIQLVVPIESLPAEATLWMAFETTLIYGPRIIVSLTHMRSQLLIRKQLMLMCENLLMPGA